MNIILIGPFPGQLSGMTLANKMLYENLLSIKELKVEKADTNIKHNVDFDLKNQGKFILKKFLYSLKPLFTISKKLLFNKYDGVYLTPGQSYLGFMKFSLFMKIAKLKKIPYFIHIHGGSIGKNISEMKNRKKKKVIKYLKHAKGIIVLGNSLRDMFDDSIPKEKIFVCENGIQEEDLLSEEEIKEKINLLKGKEEIQILYLSNLMKTKGILDLLEAALAMKKENIKFKLHLAGAIEEDIKKEVYEYIEKLKENVCYLGVVKGEDKKKLLKKAHIFCLPTYYPNEGQPISILEAMSAACAIVTTNQGGILDIFTPNENGVLCKAKNPLDIKESILRAYREYDLYALKNRKFVIESFTAKDFARRVKDIISNNLS